MKRAWLVMAGAGVILLVSTVATEVRQQWRWHEAVAIRHLGCANGHDEKRR